MRTVVRLAMIGLLGFASCRASHRNNDDVVGVVPPPQFFGDPDIETFLSEGREHVPEGSVIFYLTDPPTSGDHYPIPALGGFYDDEIAPGYLVHSLEHGAVVIYYNPFTVTPSEQLVLAAMADGAPGDFSQIICVPRLDPFYDIILTAWTHRLLLETYSQTRIENFIDLFLGDGPEQPF